MRTTNSRGMRNSFPSRIDGISPRRQPPQTVRRVTPRSFATSAVETNALLQTSQAQHDFFVAVTAKLTTPACVLPLSAVFRYAPTFRVSSHVALSPLSRSGKVFLRLRLWRLTKTKMETRQISWLWATRSISPRRVKPSRASSCPGWSGPVKSSQVPSS